MTRRRLLLVVGLAIALAALVLAPTALASAGGGSAGFGGGGGGEGGGGGGGGGVGFFILIQILVRIAVLGHGLGALVLIALFIAVPRHHPGHAERAALLDRPRRAPDRKRAAASPNGRVVSRRPRPRPPRTTTHSRPTPSRPTPPRCSSRSRPPGTGGDRARPAHASLGPDLLTEWQRRLDDLDRRGWRNRVQIIGEPTVEYVGLNHKGDATDTVTVRIEAKLRDYVEDRIGNHIKRAGRLSETVRLREFWTLGRRNGRWMLVSIEQGAEGTHAIDEAIVATTWSDENAMRDEALIEGAVKDAVPDGTKIAEVADLDFKGDAHAAALDLSLADGRFAPDVLEATARRAVTAWAEAVDGDDARLRSIAHGQAVRDLLHPGDPSGRTRVVVRGPKVERIRITGLDAAAQPPTMSVEVEIEGRRYIEDRDTTAVLAGSQSRATKFTEHWTFALDGDARQPWLIAGVGAPVQLA